MTRNAKQFQKDLPLHTPLFLPRALRLVQFSKCILARHFFSADKDLAYMYFAALKDDRMIRLVNLIHRRVCLNTVIVFCLLCLMGCD